MRAHTELLRDGSNPYPRPCRKTPKSAARSGVGFDTDRHHNHRAGRSALLIDYRLTERPAAWTAASTVESGLARTGLLGEREARTSLLARTPYELRRAAVATWLAAGVAATKVAK